MNRNCCNLLNLLALTLSTMGLTGCSSMFNPDKTISTALAGYFPETETATHEMEQQLQAVVNESTGETFSGSSSNRGPSQSNPDRQNNGSSWDKIEQAMAGDSGDTFVSLETADFGSRESARNAQQANNQTVVPMPTPKPTQEELIRIYDQINSQDPIPQKYQPLPPLIQRPVIYDESIVKAHGESNELGNQPNAPQSDISWKDSLEATIAHLEEELKSLSGPTDESENLQKCLQILNSVDNDRGFVDMVNHLKSLQESLPKPQYDALRKIIEATGQNQSSLLEQLRAAMDRVAPTANLRIQNATFCTAVNGFGKVDRFDEDRFAIDDEVLVYCELDNFAEEKATGSSNVATHRCRLDAQVEFINDSGETLFVESFADITDESESDRKDFYLFFRFRIPKLPIGTNRVQIRFHDKIGRKNATLESPLVFTVTE